MANGSYSQQGMEGMNRETNIPCENPELSIIRHGGRSKRVVLNVGGIRHEIMYGNSNLQTSVCRSQS